ncbi:MULTISPECIES: hypothetical protein [unclassified Sulfuricurvum]|uniref:hypothetical protein n=1 Tax=unclassified Sulfuricurvum TaxID=2632390 RepID=UPI0002996902|nr:MULTISPECIES: hypothetical protein [unclassified Sulfuricurvum]AFV97666.1 hypothetical protein B649_06760 [Candidatus Sulfuricurvum sp. RIFRC-1]HBM36840.1 toxin [Sulfuricurvum sp.]
MYFDWNVDKNSEIKKQRGIGFEDFITAFEEDKVLDIIEHHLPHKYPNQKLFIVEINSYIHYVPFVMNDETYFLKNIIPSRKYHKQYKG